MDFDVYTIGTGNFLEHCLNAIRLLFGGGFTGLMKQVTVISLLIVIIKYLFAPDFKSVAIWFIQVLAVTGILVVPTANVYIHDKLPDSYGFTPAVRKVANVPIGLAFMASYTSKAGNFLMEEFEDAFSGTFSANKGRNMLFGSKIIEDTMEMRSEDANIKATFRAFTMECLLQDVQAGKIRKNGYTVQELKETDDLLKFLADRTAHARRMYYSKSLEAINSTEHKPEYGLISCNKVAKILRDAVTKETEKRIPKMASGFFANFFPKSSPVNYDQAFRNSLTGAYSSFLGSSQNASDIIKQAVAVNSFKDTVETAFANVVADRTGERYYISMANMASKSIVYLRALFELLIYGLFPIAAILLLMPGSYPILKNYFISFVYLQLWMPIYAILFVVFSSQYQSMGADVSSITWNNFTKIKSMNHEIAALSGYMIFFTPFIAGLVLKMGLSSLGSLSTSMFGAQQQEAARIASDTVRGNYSTGNMNMDNHSYNNLSANKHNDNYEHFTGMKSYNSMSGARVSEFADGTSAMDMSPAINNAGGLVSIDWGSHVGRKLDNSISNSQSDMTRSSSDYLESTSNAYSTLLGYNQSFAKGSGQYKDFQDSLSAEQRKSFQDASRLIEQTSQNYNISTDDAIKLSLGASMGKEFDVLMAKGGFSAGADASKTSNLREAYEHMLSSSNSKEYSDSLGAMQSYLKSNSTKDHSSQNQDFHDSLKNDFVKSQNASKSYQEAEQRYDSYTQQRNEYAEQSQRINENLTPKFMEWVKYKKGNTEAEEIFKKGDAGTLSSLANRFIQDNGLNSPINSPTYKSKEHSDEPDSAFMGQSFFGSGFGATPKGQGGSGASISNVVNEKLNAGINQDNTDKSYENNVSKVKVGNIDDIKKLNKEVIRKDEELQPIVPKKGDDNNQQPETNNSSSQNNVVPNNPDNKGDTNIVEQSSTNANADSNESKVGGSNNSKNDDESTVFKSKYQDQAPNAFVADIHNAVGQGGLDEKSTVKKQQSLISNQLGEKKDVVSGKQTELDTKSKNNINKGVKKNIGGSILQDVRDNVNNNITAVKNTYFSVTGQPEKKQEYSKIDKPTINISGEDLKIQNIDDENQKANPQNVTSNNQAQTKQSTLSTSKQSDEIVNQDNNSQLSKNSSSNSNKNMNTNIKEEGQNIVSLDSAENKDKTVPNLPKQSSNNATSKEGVLKQNVDSDKSGEKNKKSEDE